MIRPFVHLAPLLALVLGLAACKDATLGPELTGSLQGVVLDFETNAPLARAGITTSPPTNALVSDDQGRFALQDIPAGNYTISANLPGYTRNTVTVSVQENRTTEATIFLEQESGSDAQAAMAVEVVNWANRTSSDSTFARVQYLVRNTGTIDIPAYEVYFRIGTEAGSVLHEATGTDLKVGQADVETFEAFLGPEAATEVDVVNYWFEGQP